MVLFSEQTCEIRTTPLRAFNANIAVLYVALSFVAVVIAWFGSRKTGAATFDSNIYRTVGHYDGNIAVPPSSLAPLVTLTPWGAVLFLFGALVIGALFHLVYAIDLKRMYTLLLVDRCNGMRWAQFAIIHTILAIIVAQLLGTSSFDFYVFALLALPCIGVLGYFSERAYPCCPCMMNASIFGMIILLAAYWIPVITNFGSRISDSRSTPPAYMWMALVVFFLYDVSIIAAPILQPRTRISYFFTETVSSLVQVVVSALILVCVGWALTDQNSV